MAEELQKIPGVGKKLAKELFNIGIKRVLDLKGKKPDDLYMKICDKHGFPVDRCVPLVSHLKFVDL